MAPPLLPFARKGLPSPYLIIPLTSDEASSGKATLISAGDLSLLIRLVESGAPERVDLIEKFTRLGAN